MIRVILLPLKSMMERRRIEDSIVDPSYRKVTFADDDGANQKMTKICKKYVEQWDRVAAENIGICFAALSVQEKAFLPAASQMSY